jgi:hypothetical protein
MGTEKGRTKEMTLLNKSAIRQFTLDTIKSARPHLAAKKTRVSPEYFDRIEARLRALIVNDVQAMPSSGSTIK